MKLVFISDVHVGSGRAWYSDAQSEDPYYLRRHKIGLLEILETLDKLEDFEIILGGDLLHFARPTAKELDLLGWFLLSLAKLAPTHIIAGNHEDLYGELTALHPLKTFTSDTPNLKWHLEFSETTERFGKVVWVSHNQTSKLQAYLDSNDPDFVVGHFAAKGCVYESGLTAPKGWVFDYKPGKIKRWFIGDIHLRQKLAPNASYPGTPIQNSFGETGARGYDVYDCESGKVDQIILTKTPPLLTEIVKDTLPDFKENCLYRVYASNQFLNFNFPSNVVDLKPLGNKLKEDEHNRQVIQEEIDFGDPLAGFEDTLKRTKLPESFYEEAKDLAQEIMK